MKSLFLKLAAAATLALALACGGESNPPVLNNVPVAGVAIEGKVPRMTVGEKLTLNAMLMPARATNREVSWASSNAHVASVGGSGLGVTVSAVGAGEVEITVRTSEGGFTDTFRMFVSDGSVPATGVTLDRTTMSLVPGGSALLVASLWPSDATDQSFTWTSSNTSAVTVVGNGPTAMVTAVATDKAAATITVKTASGGYTATCNVTVDTYTVPANSVSLSAASLEITTRGGTIAVTATLLPSNAEAAVTWTSSATSVATVTSPGLSTVITPVAEGYATITATASGKTASCTVRVVNKPKLIAKFARTTFDIGYTSSMAIKADGTLWGWGNNQYGKLGNGNTSVQNNPVQEARSATTWAYMSHGYQHSAAIRTDGTLWAWGYNNAGQLGTAGTTSQQTGPVQVGSATDWAVVAVGDSHTMAIKTNGTLWAWGANSNGQLGTGNTTSVTNGPVQVGTAKDWVAIECGASFTVALKDYGAVYAWGSNAYGQVADGTTTSPRSSPVQVGTDEDWVAVAAGDNHAMAIKTDGTLWGWGRNNSGQVGNGNTTTPQNRIVQVGTTNGTAGNWVAVSCGSEHTVAIKRNGTLWGWGYNTYGQVGDNSTTNRNAPVLVDAENDWTAVAANGGQHSSAIKANGSLYTWGYNSSGQIGDGTTGTANNKRIPTLVGAGYRVPN